MVVYSANSVLDGTDVYIDNFCILKGSTAVPAATTTLDTVGSRVITNVYGMTYQKISDAITLSGPGVRAEFVHGDTTRSLTEKDITLNTAYIKENLRDVRTMQSLSRAHLQTDMCMQETRKTAPTTCLQTGWSGMLPQHTWT